MIKILQSILDFLSSVVSFAIHFIQTLFKFISLIPVYVSQLMNLFTYLPTWLVGFVTVALLICVVKSVIGRE